MQVIYHQQTLDLLDQTLIEDHSQTLAQWAQQQHLAVPASVEQWYGLPTGVDILRRHSNDDHVFEPQDFQLVRYQVVSPLPVEGMRGNNRHQQFLDGPDVIS